MSMLAPTDVIVEDRAEITIGNTRMVFQLTPGTEAPAEMNVHFPDRRALFMAENANPTMHNLLPARGALVRDAKGWADYLTQSIRLTPDRATSCSRRTASRASAATRSWRSPDPHRDAYKYLRTTRRCGHERRLDGIEIAEVIQLPEVLSKQATTEATTGTMSHN